MSDITTTKADPLYYGWRRVWQKNASGGIQQVQQPLTFEDVLHPEEGDYMVPISSCSCIVNQKSIPWEPSSPTTKARLRSW